MSGKKARAPQSARIRRADLKVVEIEFSGIPGDRDLEALAEALEAAGYTVTVDADTLEVIRSDHVSLSDRRFAVPPDYPAYPGYRRKGTEDHGPAALPPDRRADSA